MAQPQSLPADPSAGRGKALLRLFVPVLVLALGACGSEGDEAAPAVPPGPCELVTLTDVEATLGSTVSGGEMGSDVPTIVVGERTCQFKLTDPNKPASVVRVGYTPNFAPLVFRKLKDQQPTAEPVADLGDEALWVDNPKALVVLRGDKVLTVVVFGAAVTDHRQRAITLATAALKRL